MYLFLLSVDKNNYCLCKQFLFSKYLDGNWNFNFFVYYFDALLFKVFYSCKRKVIINAIRFFGYIYILFCYFIYTGGKYQKFRIFISTHFSINIFLCWEFNFNHYFRKTKIQKKKGVIPVFLHCQMSNHSLNIHLASSISLSILFFRSFRDEKRILSLIRSTNSIETAVLGSMFPEKSSM